MASEHGQTTVKDALQSALLSSISTNQKLADAFQKESRSRNMRFMIFMGPTLLFTAFIIFGSIWKSYKAPDEYVALINIRGEIGLGKSASADYLLPSINNAFKDDSAKAVILRISSPGGSPVQSKIIYDKILDLRTEFPHKPIIAVGEELLTSGAYYIAAAANEIYVQPATMTGSVGVVMQGFGFSDILEKIGIERRVFTSGNKKVTLDPFADVTPENKEKVIKVLTQVHDIFITDVKVGRAEKLKGDETVMFSGDYWVGSDAMDMGLVDGISSFSNIVEGRFNDLPIRDYTRKQSPWQRLNEMGAFVTTLSDYLPDSGY